MSNGEGEGEGEKYRRACLHAYASHLLGKTNDINKIR